MKEKTILKKSKISKNFENINNNDISQAKTKGKISNKNLQSMSTDICKIKQIHKSPVLNDILSKITHTVDTYNKLMNNYEDVSIVLINNLETIIMHHLVFFCHYHNIKIFICPNLRGKILAIKQTDPVIKEINEFLNNEDRCKIVDIYESNTI
ncbi:uncharacterized protein VNE69_10103 [Vairimorpha necatrix]|uniref:Ribosomal protein L7Ae/L30e/S12e/Gadd45 domain-containing protein n=1 Tax=Vairimorpha necatrix TaxID=6039 RepID=A0AAX4JFQ9_9MICR